MSNNPAISTLLNNFGFRVADNTWKIEWTRDASLWATRSLLLDALMRNCGGLLLDTEESPLELKGIPVQRMPGIKGLGHVFTVRECPPSSLEHLLSWLDPQSWFSADPSIRTTSLAWEIDQWFSHPEQFRAYGERINAKFAVIPYYDGVEWLLYLSSGTPIWGG